MTEGRMQSKTGMGGDESAVYCGRSFERARGLSTGNVQEETEVSVLCMPGSL